jgi:hypothetical protein
MGSDKYHVKFHRHDAYQLASPAQEERACCCPAQAMKVIKTGSAAASREPL